MSRVVRELLYVRPERKGTSKKNALDFLLKVAKRKSVVFIISDFLDNHHWDALRIANRIHDLIGIHLYDPAELDIPEIGLVKIEDPETGSMFWVDTSSYTERQELQKKIIGQMDDLNKKALSMGFDMISIATDQDFVDPLMRFFKRREKRY